MNTELIIKDYKDFFDKLVDSIVVNACYISYSGLNVRLLHQDFYDLILKDARFNDEARIQWQHYVTSNFKTRFIFNSWCKKKRSKLAKKVNQVVFNQDDINLYFLPVDNYLEIYTRTSPDNFKLHYLTNSTKPRFWNECMTSLEIDGSYKILDTIPRYVYTNALKNSVNRKVNFIQEIKKIANNPNVPCHFYLALPTRKVEVLKIEAWITFISQFSTKKMQEDFMSWIYGIFQEDDYDRRICWIESSNETGKSSVTYAFIKFMMKINRHSVKGLQSEKDLFQLSNFDKCRLVVMPDLKSPDIFSNQVIYNITGGDYCEIREPYQASTFHHLLCKILITSNISPTINLKKGDQTSRMLHITMDMDNVYRARNSFGSNYRDRLEKQLLPFIYFCKQFYKAPPKVKKTKRNANI